MFRAKHIANRKYYDWRRLLLIGSVVWFPLQIITLSFNPVIWVLYAFFACILVIVFLMSGLQHKIKRQLEESVVEMYPDRITVRDKTGQQIDHIALGATSHIAISKPNEIIDYSFWEQLKNMIGKGRETYVRINSDDHAKRFDFLLDSYYLAKQLDKVVALWEQRGLNVRRV